MKTKRRVFPILLIALLLVQLSGLSLAARAERSTPERIEYTGEGVVWRSSDDIVLMQVFSLISELNVAYLSCDQAYLTPGTTAIWTAVAEGGAGGCQYRFAHYFRPYK